MPTGLSREPIDWAPTLLVVALVLLALPMMGSFSSWLTITLASLAMGMMIFTMASGLTLVFGLMHVLNFGHGVFISVGAYAGLIVLLPLTPWLRAESIGLNLAAMALGAAVAMVATGGFGYLFERLIIRPVYGQHLKQILVTMGGMIIAEQMILVIWGPDQIPLPLPPSFRGSITIGDVVLQRYRLLAVGLGLAVFVAMYLVLNRTRLGMLIRAGVENPEMVESLGYHIRRLFIGVFVAGSALAGLGGVMWGFYRETLTAGMGMEVMVMIFIVVIIGGLGSVGGCFVGALLVALVANYSGFLVPKIALGSNIILMVLILLWRPQGLHPVAR